jgi:protein-disulfide isomerase-like protein with CxxC motif
MGSQALSDGDASLTDTAVQSLRFTHPHLHKTQQHYYVQGLDIKRVATLMHKAESTIKAHLDASDPALALWFHLREEAQAKARQLHKRASTGLAGSS